MASSSTNIASPLYAGAISERLTKANHLTWKAQVLAVLRGAHLVGHISGAVKPLSQEIDGKEKDERVPNPAYEEWYASDQQVLGFLFSSISKEVLPQFATKETTVDAWKEIEGMFSLHTRARKVDIQLQLATTQKGNLFVADYVNKMRSLIDDMATPGRVIEEEELVEYILTGLGQEYDSWWSISSPALVRSMTQLRCLLLPKLHQSQLVNYTHNSWHLKPDGP
jgi:hypothetical protein